MLRPSPKFREEESLLSSLSSPDQSGPSFALAVPTAKEATRTEESNREPFDWFEFLKKKNLISKIKKEVESITKKKADEQKKTTQAKADEGKNVEAKPDEAKKKREEEEKAAREEAEAVAAKATAAGKTVPAAKAKAAKEKPPKKPSKR